MVDVAAVLPVSTPNELFGTHNRIVTLVLLSILIDFIELREI